MTTLYAQTTKAVDELVDVTTLDTALRELANDAAVTAARQLEPTQELFLSVR